MGRIIAVGTDPGAGQVDLIHRPRDPSPMGRTGLNVHLVETLPDALHALRQLFSDHKSIASLGGTTVVGDDLSWTVPIEHRLCEFLEDLGNCPLDSWTGARNAIANGFSLSHGLTSASLYQALKDAPAICVGSGPSATPAMLAQVARLARNHYVFAADTIVDALKEHGCTPHFVCMIERQPEMAETVARASTSATLIAPPVIDPRSAAPFNRTIWWWQGDDLYRWLGPNVPPMNAGRSAGTLSVAAAVLAGCKTIYLVGHDLAFDKGFTGYAQQAHSLAPGTLVDNADSVHENGGYGASRLQVMGWSGHPVWTSGLWNMFRADIEEIIRNNPASKIYCVASDYRGAYIEGVQHLSALPECGPLKPAQRFPALTPMTIQDPRERIAYILKDLATIHEAAAMAEVALRDDACPLDDLANELAVAALVSGPNVPLFRYVFRSINTSLALRMHMRAGQMKNPADCQRDCLSILAKTLQALCVRMGRDLVRQ